MSERDALMKDFLQRSGWGDAVRISLGGDASTRHYDRLQFKNKSYFLMDAPMSGDAIDGNDWHLDMTDAERRAMGVDAMRWRAGSRMEAFICINGWLEAQGFSVPHVYAYDVKNGFAILEDLGNGQYWNLLEKENKIGDEVAMYEAAVDALIKLDRITPPLVLEYENIKWRLPTFDRLVVEMEADMFPEWYVERHGGQKLSSDAMLEYKAAWQPIAAALATQHDKLITRDYHSPNLMWLPDREGYRRAGILDHQDSVLSHPSFNLMFLLNDPRRDVPEALQKAMLDRYFAGTGFNRDEFMTYYAYHLVLQAFRIAGLFCRLSYRDGKTHFMAHVPRMERYIRKGLSHPSCGQLHAWLNKYLPDFMGQEAA